MDKRQIIAALVAQTGIKLDEDDPAFLLVELNRLMLENSANEAAQNLTVATEKFNAVTTRSVDDFVDVANEALSKFIQRTNELKEALDAMAEKDSVASAPVAPITASAVTLTTATPRRFLPWATAIFSLGLVVGVLLSFAFQK